MLASQEGATSNPANAKAAGKDPKKDAKKPAKGATVEVDRNAPKALEIEYPEVASECDYILIEKSFIGNKSGQADKAAAKRAALKSQMTDKGSAAGGAGAAS